MFIINTFSFFQFILFLDFNFNTDIFFFLLALKDLFHACLYFFYFFVIIYFYFYLNNSATDFEFFMYFIN